MKNAKSRGVEISEVAIFLIAIGFSANTKAADDTVTFNDPRSLAALIFTEGGGRKIRAGRYTFVDEGPPPAAYVEDCAVISEGVTPPPIQH